MMEGERARLVLAHEWIRLFKDGRKLVGCDEQGVKWEAEDGDTEKGLGLCVSWSQVEADLREHNVVVDVDLSKGELAAKRALGMLAVMLLLMGCATWERVDQNTIDVQLLEWKVKKLHRSIAGFHPPEPLKISGSVLATTVLSGMDSLGPPMHGMDMRWGKCEEHGKWWALLGLGARETSSWWVDSFSSGPITEDVLRFVCLGPPLHYIEREIEGPKP